MLNRRSLLLAAGLLTLNQLLAGCRVGGKGGVRVRTVSGAIPAQILQAFQRLEQGQNRLEFLASKQLAESFQLLQTWKNPAKAKSAPLLGLSNAQPAVIDDLVLLGDFWLSAAIQQGLIQPLPVATISGWQKIPALWQQLVQRDPQGAPNLTGQLWAVPYRWGSLVIAYNVEKFKQLGWTPTDWTDLWRPELKGQISLLDSARVTLGLTLKKLGQSVNADLSTDISADVSADSPTTLPLTTELTNNLKSLHQQVKFYSSSAYLQPLLIGDSWLAVGWSTEVLPTAKRDRRIAAVVPQSGTILTADLWVRPAGAGAQPNANQPPAQPNPSPQVSPSPAASPQTSPQASPQSSPVQPSAVPSPPADLSSSPASPLAAPVSPPVSPDPNAPASSSNPDLALNPALQQWLEFCWQPDIATQISQLSSAASPIILADRAKLPAKLQANSLLLPPAEILDRSEFLLPVKDLAAYRRLWETMRQTGLQTG